MATLRDLAKRLTNVFNDDKGFFQRGRPTAQPIQQFVQQAPRQVNYFAQNAAQRMIPSIALQSIQNSFRTASSNVRGNIGVLGQNLNLIRTNPQFAQQLPSIIANQSQRAVSQVYGQNNPFNIIPQTAIGLMKAGFQGLTTPFTRKSGFEKAGDVAGAIGASMMPARTIGYAAINPVFKTGETLITKGRLPTGAEYSKSYDEGIDFGAKLAAIEGAAGIVLKPLLSKIRPVEIKSINTYLDLARRATSSEIRKQFIKLATKRIMQNLSADALKAGVGFGAYGLTKPAENIEVRIENGVTDFVTGVAFSTTLGIAKYGSQAIGGQVIKPLVEQYRAMPKSVTQGGYAKLDPQSMRKIGIGLTPSREAKMPNLHQQENFTEEVIRRGGPIQWLKSKLYPLKIQPKDVQSAIKDRQISKAQAIVDANGINVRAHSTMRNLGVDPKTEWRLVQWSELTGRDAKRFAETHGLTDDVLAKVKPFLNEHRAFEYEIRSKAQKAGFDLGFIENHIVHKYQEPANVVAEVTKTMGEGLKQKPGFTYSRTTPPYAFTKGKLTPRYTTFGQLHASSYHDLQTAISNQRILNSLVKEGRLLPASKAPREWRPIVSETFPRAQGNEPYYAPKETASFLNNIFGGVETNPLISGAAAASRQAQDIVLAGGLRKINFFTLAQTIKDITAGVGTTLSGHPITGGKMAIKPLVNVVRGFIPGASRRFEQANQQYIDEMAAGGLRYYGVNSYDGLQRNVAQSLSKRGKDEVGRLWNSYSNNPTFKEFMFQRQVDLYKTFKSGLVRKYGEQEAKRIAIEQLRHYDGIIDDIGRNPDLQNGITGIFLAPKYRESIIGSLTNAVRSIPNIKDPNYAISRGLAIGMAATLYAYNELNKSLNNGRDMWDNPAGRELELVIPDANDPNHYYSIPWMPGFTATPRRLLGTVTSLAKGEPKEAVRQFGGLLSIPVSKATEIISGKDYYGNPIIDVESDKSVTEQMLRYGIKSFTPGPVRERLKYEDIKEVYEKKIAQGKKATKPSIALSILRSFEMPIKEGKYSSQFYTFEDKELKSLKESQLDTYKDIYHKKVDPESDYATRFREQVADSQKLLQNPEVLKARERVERTTAEKLGQEINPFFNLTPTQQQIVLNMKSLAPGDSVKGQMTTENISWLKPYWESNERFYGALKEKGVIGHDMRDPEEIFTTTPAMRAKLDTYYSFTSGTGERSAYLRANPDLRDYWDEKAAFTNGLRAMLGLPPMPEKNFGFASGGGGGRPRKISFRIATVKTPKTVAFRIGKTKRPSIKIGKNTVKAYKYKIAKSKSTASLKAYKAQALKTKFTRRPGLFG